MDTKTLTMTFSTFSEWCPLSRGEISKLPKQIGAYVFRNKNGQIFGRLSGSSDILYIGKTTGKRGLRQRLYQYMNPGPTQWTNQRINSFIEKYGIEFSYCLDNNPEALELKLLRKYHEDHDELPPFNRSSGRIWKLGLVENITLRDTVE